MKLAARYYRALPVDAPGYESIHLDLDPTRTAFVGIHCWNIGCPDGPSVDTAYCVGMGWPDATAEASRIMIDVIRPMMDAAREEGIPVCHVETDWMADRYPDILSRRKERPASPQASRQREMLERAHGKNYLDRSPLATMQRAEIVSPLNNEPLFFYTDPFDAWLKARHIDTLIYAGFATDMCVLGAEGGARPMLARDYRCILVRDATVGVETPESFPERLATSYGIHRFEWQVGFSTTSEDVHRAFEEFTTRRSPD